MSVCNVIPSVFSLSNVCDIYVCYMFNKITYLLTYRGARSGSPEPALTDYGHTVAASRHTPQSTTLGLHPVIHVHNYMDHYSLADP